MVKIKEKEKGQKTAPKIYVVGSFLINLHCHVEMSYCL